MAVKGVRFLMWSRVHGTEKLVDEASFSLDFGHFEIVEDLVAVGEHQGKSNSRLERKVTYQLFHTPTPLR